MTGDSRSEAELPTGETSAGARTSQRGKAEFAPRWAVIGIFLIMLFGALYLSRSFVLPVVFALLFMLVLSPVVRVAKRRLRIWEPVTASILVFGTLILLVGGAYLLSSPMTRLVGGFPEYIEAVNSELSGLRERFLTMQEVREEARDAAGTGGPTADAVVLSGPSLLGNVATVVPHVSASIAFALLFLFFLLSSGNLFYRKTIESLPNLSDKKRALTIASEIETELSRYLFAITTINAGLGVAIALGMWAVGLPMPAVYGALAFVLNFIPYLGAIGGIALVGLVGLSEFGSFAEALFPALTYMAITSVEGQLITPVLVGRRLRMNAPAVFLAVAFWGWIWGVVGMFLAVPLMVSVKIVASYFEPLHPLANFLAAEDRDEATTLR